MALTTAQQIAAIEAARDAAYTALENGTGFGPLSVQYVQDPDGGQTTFRDPEAILAYIDRLESKKAALVDRQEAEDAGITGTAGAFVLVRRRK